MKTYVFCISSLGSSFIAELLQDDAPEGKKCYRYKTVGIDKYAKVLDIEYNQEVYQQWGYDCFTIEDADKKYHGRATRMFNQMLAEKKVA